MPVMPLGIRNKLKGFESSVRRLPVGGVFSLIAGFFLMLSMGGPFLTFGNLSTYITSYMHVRMGQDVDYGQLMWVESTFVFVGGTGMLLSSYLHQKFGPRVPIILGSIVNTSSIALTSRTIRASLPWVVLTYGIFSGLGSGIMYVIPMLVGQKWFPQNKGLVNGIVQGGYGIAGIFYSSVQTNFINPNLSIPAGDGFFRDDALLDRVPFIFLIEAGVCCSAQIIAILSIHDPPPSKVNGLEQNTEDGTLLAKYNTFENMNATNTTKESATNNNSNLPTETIGSFEAVTNIQILKNAFRTSQAYQLLITFFFFHCTMAATNPLWKAFGQTFILDDQFLLVVGSGLSVCSMLGRVFWGLLCDVCGYKRTMLAMSGILSALMYALPATPLGGKFLFLVSMWMVIFCSSGIFSISITGTAQTFGADNSGPIYSVIFLVASLGEPLMSLASNLMLESYDYWTVFVLAGALMTCAMIVTFGFRTTVVA